MYAERIREKKTRTFDFIYITSLHYFSQYIIITEKTARTQHIARIMTSKI